MQLPFEIWKNIVSYLPVIDVKELYAVNSTLFNIAMDLRYQEAWLWIGTPKARVCKYLRVFRYPLLSCRPKTLYIYLGSIAESLSQMKKETPKTPNSSLGRFMTNFIKKNKSEELETASEIIGIGLNALPQLTAVTKLSIIHDYNGACHDAPLILQLLQDTWQTLGNQLRSLQVQVVFENLGLVIPTSLHLPKLQILTIKAGGVSTVKARAHESIISTVIQSHASSLRNVSFTTGNAAVDTRPIFRSLQVLPCLRAIHLSFPFGRFIPSPFPAKNMLYNCRHHLESLSLEFESFMGKHRLRSSTLFNEDWCSVDLPRLRDLRINPPIMDFSQDFVDYIHRFAPSLISLWIKHNLVFRYSDLHLICRDFLCLRNLTLTINWFCPEVLALLARRLPRLQVLHLRFKGLSSSKNKAVLSDRLSIKFYLGMQQYTRVFHEWQLVSLDYTSIYSAHAIERALFDHLPNVKWFCRVERSIYLSRIRT